VSKPPGGRRDETQSCGLEEGKPSLTEACVRPAPGKPLSIREGAQKEEPNTDNNEHSNPLLKKQKRVPPFEKKASCGRKCFTRKNHYTCSPKPPKET